MRAIDKKIVRDQQDRPVAVLVDYQDWLEIERLLAPLQEAPVSTDLSRFAGTIQLTEDPLAFQRRCRDEWS